jgi:hypothetical protein
VLAVVIPLALVAALMYSYSDYLEQQAAHAGRREEDPADDRSKVVRLFSAAGAMMRRLVHDRTWTIGWVIGTLALGSVAVVQTLQVTSLLWAIPLTARSTPYRPSPRDYVGAGLLGAGLVAVIAVRGSAGGAPDGRRPSVLLFIAIAVAVVLLIAMALEVPRPIRVTLLAIAAGVCYGCSAALVKLTSNDLTSVGIPGTATDWPGYTLALSTAVGTVVQQFAFAAGRLAAATTAIFVANPLVGYAIAVFGFGEPFPHSPGRLAGLAVAGACATVGIAMLAHSRLLFGKDAMGEGSDDDPRRRASGATGRCEQPA